MRHVNKRTSIVKPFNYGSIFGLIKVKLNSFEGVHIENIATIVEGRVLITVGRGERGGEKMAQPVPQNADHQKIATAVPGSAEESSYYRGTSGHAAYATVKAFTCSHTCQRCIGSNGVMPHAENGPSRSQLQVRPGVESFMVAFPGKKIHLWRI